MVFGREIENFICDFTQYLRDESVAIFAGAGLSSGSGYVDWKGLLRNPARRIGLDVERETDMVTLAQYIYNDSNTKQPLAELIKNSFNNNGNLNENHRILSRLPIKTFWTTNYDSLIENSLKESGKNPDVKRKASDLTTIIRKRDAIVYKMHGDVDNAEEAVLIKDDYELYEVKNQLFTINLKGDLVSKTFLFIGFGFEDPNLEYILSKVRILTNGYSRKHYCFFRKVNRKSYKDGEDGDRNFQYDCIKQDFKCADLKRYNITPLLVDEYEDITQILKSIEERYKMNSILISGSADLYDDFKLNNIDGVDFSYELSKALNKCEYKIVTGFGKGVGSAVINGVIDSVNETYTRNLDDHLVLRPFPQYASKGQDYEEIKKKYRENLVNECGIAIFILGNKIDKGIGIPADGVVKEFDRAVETGVKVVPIGATGYVSKELWDKVVNNFDDYYPHHSHLKSKFELIGQEGIDYKEIIKAVIDIVKELNREA